MNFWPFIFFLLTWSVAGSALCLATKCLTPRLPNAALRHSMRAMTFLCIALIPLWLGLQAAWVVRTSSNLCIPTTPWSASTSLASGQFWGSILIAIWGSGAFWILARGWMACCTLKRWRRQSRRYQFDSDRSLVQSLHGVEVLLAVREGPVVPITWGIRKPVILLPCVATNWSEARLAAVLAHEQGHVRRFDNLTQLLALTVCAIHWFNPIFWRSAAALEADAEIAADDFAILQGTVPSSYAQELLGIAKEVSGFPAHRTFAQTAMVKQFTLQHRLVAIVDANARRGPVDRGLQLRMAAALVVIMATSSLLTSRISFHRPTSTVATASCVANIP